MQSQTLQKTSTEQGTEVAFEGFSSTMTQFTLFILFSKVLLLKASIDYEARKVALNTINAHRENYGARPLSWNLQVEGSAQGCAERLARDNVGLIRSNPLKKSTSATYGEALYMIKPRLLDSSKVALMAIKSWMDEADRYDYGHPGLSSATKDFTQVVWKSSRDLGIGIASNEQATYVVAYFWPKGNLGGQFEDNVGKPGLG